MGSSKLVTNFRYGLKKVHGVEISRLINVKTPYNKVKSKSLVDKKDIFAS
jgi:hypothetical protein